MGTAFIMLAQATRGSIPYSATIFKVIAAEEGG